MRSYASSLVQVLKSFFRKVACSGWIPMTTTAVKLSFSVSSAMRSRRKRSPSFRMCEESPTCPRETPEVNTDQPNLKGHIGFKIGLGNNSILSV